ncbi:hypothetical protein EYM_02520 [Ignicoccus islandicus DSM 13165]|uniref:Uncharacterized protein n=1 Tax=Ignicoccus islandicus DSM 13165 TaxID=940295 RepID=A0A0U3E346_9CREN|nr:hypothetical protein [Ignicoccus islandicus]ALU12331.1 hypothetical protein EYM_02520 [Ignicoccus islandicus DSM 13165]
MTSALRLKAGKFKLPTEAKNCKECIFYISLAKWCAKHEMPIADPEKKNCTAKNLLGNNVKPIEEFLTI